MKRPICAADTFGMELLPSSTIPSGTPRALERHHQFFNWVAESRAHRVVLLVVGIWVLNAFDLLLTLLAHQRGLLQEGSPVARWILGLGTPSVILFKVGLVMIGSYPLLRFRTARITELGTLVILLAYALLAVHWSACYDLYAATIQADQSYAAAVETLGRTIYP